MAYYDVLADQPTAEQLTATGGEWVQIGPTGRRPRSRRPRGVFYNFASNGPETPQLTAWRLRELRKQLAGVYELVRATLRDGQLRGHDAILFDHPVKSPFLEMYDSLGEMATEIEAGKWTKEDA